MNIELVEIDHSATLSTTYRMEESFQNYFATDVQLTDADKEAIKARPELLAILWFTGVQNGLSFTKSSIHHLYLGNEG